MRGHAVQGQLGAPSTPLSGVNLKLSFPGANPTPRLEPLNRQATHVSYFVGRDAAKWQPDVPVWGGVRYRDLIAGFDLEIRGDGGQWGWSLRPSAEIRAAQTTKGAPPTAQSPPDLRLQVDGAGQISIEDGVLRIGTGNGGLHLPLLTTDVVGSASARSVTTRGAMVTVTSPFDWRDDAARNRSSMAADSSSDALYSTYLGGSYDDLAASIAVDRSGDAYLTGKTYSTDFPLTPGAFQSACGGCESYYSDTFITELNPTGTGLLYSTYLGGNSYDEGNGIAVDGNGNAYVAGWTESPDFPTTSSAFRTTYPGCPYQDCGAAFVAKLNSSGTGLLYSTYLGGSGSVSCGYGCTGTGDYAASIAVDSNGNAFVTGQATSSDFPLTSGAYQTVLRSPGGNAFVAKINPLGTGLTFSTYLGGSGGDNGGGIAIDGSGAAYITGNTTSEDFPTTADAFQPNLPECLYGFCDSEAFISKLDATGSALLYSTYLGGSSGYEFAEGIVVDGNGSAYITGQTYSPDFPTTPGAFQTAMICIWDVYQNSCSYAPHGFVTKLNSNGTGLVYSTFVGSPGTDFAYGIALDSGNNAFITGYTWSSGFPVTPGAFQSTYPEESGQGFVAALDSRGSNLIYGTYLGGMGDSLGGPDPETSGRGIAVDTAGDVFVAGFTRSINFPTTTGAFQTNYPTCTVFDSGCQYRGFVTKLMVGTTSRYSAMAFPCSNVPYSPAYPGALLVPASSWAPASLLAMPRPADGSTLDVYSNYFEGSCNRPDNGGAVRNNWGDEYQCAELAVRVADYEWNTGGFSAWTKAGWANVAYTGSSNDMWGVAPKLGLSRFSNGGSSLPLPGDLLIFSESGAGSAGHVGVVYGSDGSNVYFVGENQAWGEFYVPYSEASGLYHLDGTSLGSGFAVVGWLRGTSHSVVASPPTVPSDGVTRSNVSLIGVKPGDSIAFFTTRGSIDRFMPATGTASASGIFSAQLVSSTPGTATITAEDLTTGQFFSASATVTFTPLSGQVAPPPPNGWAATITAVQPSQPLNGRFLQGIPNPNTISVTVDWQGGSPGQVNFILNGQTYSEPASTSGASHTFDMGADLIAGQNSLQIVAVNAAGQPSQPEDFSPYSIAEPAWLTGLAAVGALGSNLVPSSSNGEYDASVDIPSDGINLGAPDFGPPGSDSELNLKIEGGVKLPYDCSQPAQIDASAALDPKITLVDTELGGELKGSGSIQEVVVQCDVQTLQGTVRLDISVYGQKNWPILVFVVNFISAGAGTALEAALPSDVVNVLGYLYLKGQLNGFISSNVQTTSASPWLQFSGTQLGGGPQVETGYQFDELGAELKIYLSASGSAAFNQPGSLTDLSDLAFDSLTLTGQAGITVEVLGFEQNPTYQVQWVYPTGAQPTVRSGQATPSWHLVPHPSAVDYARFQTRPNQPRAFSRAATRAGPTALLAPSTITDTLVTNVYTYAVPSLAVDPLSSNALLTWVTDDLTKPVGQSHEIAASLWNGSAWSPPANVTDDLLTDDAPQVAWANDGNGVAVWQRITETLSVTATWDASVANSLEIATASYSPTSGTWSPVSLLTSNGALDAGPKLARNGNGQLLAVWRENDAGLLSGNPANPDRLITAFYDHGWGSPAAAIDGIPGVVDYAIGYGSNAATITYNEVITPTSTLSPTLELFSSTWDGTSWSPPAQITTSAVNQSRPAVVYNAANQPLLIWLNGSTIQLQNLATGSVASLALPSSIGTVDDFQLVQDAAGDLAVVFSAEATQRDLFVSLYDQAFGLWGSPVQLTDDPNSESSPSPGLDSTGRLLLAYTSTAINQTTQTGLSGTGQVVTYTVPVEGETDLLTLSHPFVQSLSLSNSDLALSNPHAAAGSSVVITATVHDTGDLALSGVSASFYDGDPKAGGTLIGTNTLPTPLAAGFSAPITTTYTVPSIGGMHTLYGVASAPGVSTTSNVGSLNAFGPDLALLNTSVNYWGGNTVGLQSRIANVGSTASPATTIAYAEDASTGTLLVTDAIPGLSAGQAITLTTPLTTTTLAPGIDTLAAQVNPSGFPEANTANDVFTTTLSVEPDLMVSPFSVWASPLPSGPVVITATLYNVGPITATNATVGFYSHSTLDPGSLVFTQTVPALAPASAVQVTGQAPAPLGCGLWEVADPFFGQTETTRANNVASIPSQGVACANFQLAPPAGGGAPLAVAFADTSTGSTTSWLWDFGDGATSTFGSPSHVYSAPGSYTVTLTVGGPDGTDRVARSGVVNVTSTGAVAPHVGFTATATAGSAPLVVNFVDQSWGTITNWSWDFGDGATSADEFPEHTYLTPGAYNVSLTVSGPAGSDSLTETGLIDVGATLTGTPTPSLTPSASTTATPTPTETSTPSSSSTPTVRDTATQTQTTSTTPTSTLTQKGTLTPTVSPTEASTATGSSTPTQMSATTPSPTPTFTPAASATVRVTSTPSSSPTALPFSTSTPSPTDTAGPTDTPTMTASTTLTMTPRLTSSPTATASPTPTVTGIAVNPGTPTQVATVIGEAQIALSIPGGNIARISIAPPSAPLAITPVTAEQPLLAIAISATDPNGQSVRQLSAPITLDVTFLPPPDLDPFLAQLYTIDASGAAQLLATRITANADGTYTASAQITYLSDFELFAPTRGTPLATSTSTPTATRSVLETPSPTLTPFSLVTVVADATIDVSAPPQSTPIGQIRVRLPSSTPPITPKAATLQDVWALEIDAVDSQGTPIHHLSAPMSISVRFWPPDGSNPLLAQIYTVDEVGETQQLPTTVTPNGNGSYTAVALTSHLSPFVLFAPGIGTPIPLAFLPAVSDGTGAGW